MIGCRSTQSLRATSGTAKKWWKLHFWSDFFFFFLNFSAEREKKISLSLSSRSRWRRCGRKKKFSVSVKIVWNPNSITAPELRTCVIWKTRALPRGPNLCCPVELRGVPDCEPRIFGPRTKHSKQQHKSMCVKTVKKYVCENCVKKIENASRNQIFRIFDFFFSHGFHTVFTRFFFHTVFTRFLSQFSTTFDTLFSHSFHKSRFIFNRHKNERIITQLVKSSHGFHTVFTQTHTVLNHTVFTRFSRFSHSSGAVIELGAIFFFAESYWRGRCSSR